ncbi:MAG: PEGA domain-containing protein [Planctomycetota bacterium]|nr:MAG: PEGA domain-containing protein [Planctomycetota bacterium]
MVLHSGCVHRRLTIRSDPPGAHVTLDGEELGVTPVSTDFTYYGTHEITLTKAGYETLTVMQRVPTPWYQIPPLDLIADNFWPFPITNRHEFRYRLTPRQPASTDALLERARELRSEAQLGIP